MRLKSAKAHRADAYQEDTAPDDADPPFLVQERRRIPRNGHHSEHQHTYHAGDVRPSHPCEGASLRTGCTPPRSNLRTAASWQDAGAPERPRALRHGRAHDWNAQGISRVGGCSHNRSHACNFARPVPRTTLQVLDPRLDHCQTTALTLTAASQNPDKSRIFT